MPYPLDLDDTPDSVDNCDFGGTPRPDGRMEPHSALGSSGIIPIICQDCHAVCCYECASPDDYDEAFPDGNTHVEAGPSNVPESSNDVSGDSPKSDNEGSGNLPESNNDYTGKGKDRAP